jgi:hypothetical protein
MAKLHELEAGKGEVRGGGGHERLLAENARAGNRRGCAARFRATGRVSGPPRVVGER